MLSDAYAAVPVVIVVYPAAIREQIERLGFVKLSLRVIASGIVYLYGLLYVGDEISGGLVIRQASIADGVEFVLVCVHQDLIFF
jgi:hypothetical protein